MQQLQRLFSIIGAIKSKLRNFSAIPMVDAILSMRYSLTRGNENCSKFEVLPKMMQWFNASMYDYKRPQTVAPAVNPDDDEEVLQVLNDVEKLIGEPVFIIQ